jgi:hypothetical protein
MPQTTREAEPTMHNEKPQVFIDIDLQELDRRVADYGERGWRFVNICGSTVEDGVELIYSFSDGLPLENLRLTVGDEDVIPSVSDRFPNAFFFENETHDLFGVSFSGISIDFDGEFYAVAVPTPMNPHSTDAREAAAEAAAEPPAPAESASPTAAPTSPATPAAPVAAPPTPATGEGVR